jgi:hypothetical protein
MLCPYNTVSHIQENKNIYDENGYVEKVIVKEVWGNSQCLKENCAVWSEGRCRYNG